MEWMRKIIIIKRIIIGKSEDIDERKFKRKYLNFYC